MSRSAVGLGTISTCMGYQQDGAGRSVFQGNCTLASQNPQNFRLVGNLLRDKALGRLAEGLVLALLLEGLLEGLGVAAIEDRLTDSGREPGKFGNWNSILVPLPSFASQQPLSDHAE